MGDNNWSNLSNSDQPNASNNSLSSSNIPAGEGSSNGAVEQSSISDAMSTTNGPADPNDAAQTADSSMLPNIHAPPLSLSDFQLAWTGSVAGQAYGHLPFDTASQAIRRRRTPAMLTMQWPQKLEIVLFMPTRALQYTSQNYCRPMDYVFFYISESNNFDLHRHLKNNNLCAKIDLYRGFPHQVVIITPTESKYHYIGLVFPGDVIFIEPV